MIHYSQQKRKSVAQEAGEPEAELEAEPDMEHEIMLRKRSQKARKSVSGVVKVLCKRRMGQNQSKKWHARSKNQGHGERQ